MHIIRRKLSLHSLLSVQGDHYAEALSVSGAKPAREWQNWSVMLPCLFLQRKVENYSVTPHSQLSLLF